MGGARLIPQHDTLQNMHTLPSSARTPSPAAPSSPHVYHPPPSPYNHEDTVAHPQTLHHPHPYPHTPSPTHPQSPRSPTSPTNGHARKDSTAYSSRPPTLRSRSYSIYEHSLGTPPAGPGAGTGSELDEKDEQSARSRSSDELDEKYSLPGTGRWKRRRRKRDYLFSFFPFGWRVPAPFFSHSPRIPAYPTSPRLPSRRRNWYMAPVYLPLPMSISSLLKCLLPLAALLLCIISLLDISLSLEIYRKSWIAREIKHVEPLSGCFSPSRISPSYNLTLARGPKHYELHAGTPMRFGTDCYDFAGTIGEAKHHIERTVYHMYWRADLLPFGERQSWTLKSFFATQDVSKSLLILWSNGDLSHHSEINKFMQLYPEHFQVRMVDIEELARGTPLEGSPHLAAAGGDQRAWVDGDLVRLLVVWYYGGVWVDMDSLLTRDLAPLTESEWVVQWDCYDKKFMPLNGAILHFQQHSPYLCEAFHIMATSPPPEPNSIDWGSRLYHKLWRRLLSAGVEPFKILPWCFIDGANCAYDNSLPDPFKPDGRYWGEGRTFENGGDLERIAGVQGKVFSLHLHNRWDKGFPRGGWVERMLLNQYEERLGREI